MMSYRIHPLPNFFGPGQTGYMPQYRRSGSAWNIGVDEWHSYKQHAQEMIFTMPESAHSFLAGKCNYNYALLAMRFAGTF